METPLKLVKAAALPPWALSAGRVLDLRDVRLRSFVSGPAAAVVLRV
jgi:hypothetical protein